MAEHTTAGFKPGTLPNLNSNIVNQKSFAVSGTHTDTIQTITTSSTITGITAPQYLINCSTGEIIYAEGISGNSFINCTRGADGTTATAMSTGQVLRPVITANLYNQLVREIMAMAEYVNYADPLMIRTIASQEAIRFIESIRSILEAFMAQKGKASGLATLDGSSLVVQNPANATATPTANKIPISDADGKLNENWINSGDLLAFIRVCN